MKEVRLTLKGLGAAAAKLMSWSLELLENYFIFQISCKLIWFSIFSSLKLESL